MPKFNGATSWEQYQQVFDAIVLSNGWDDVTAALQLLSHLEGDALNVALLVPASRQASWIGLVGALSAHYGSPGLLADYRRQFEKTTRKSGEDPSIFAMALETLAIEAFGDMGQTARLCITRDRFIAGHVSCELCRNLDSVSPETPIWDIVDRCRVWESHADSDVRRVGKPGPDLTFPTYMVSSSDGEMDDIWVAAVTNQQSTSDQLETFLRKLLAGTAVPAPAPRPEPPTMLLQRLLVGTPTRQPIPDAPAGSSGLETLLKTLFSGNPAPTQRPRPGPIRRDWATVVCFSCGKGNCRDRREVFRSSVSDPVCPVALEIRGWQRCEAFRNNRYVYYEDFDGRSKSSEYNDPWDYREWDDWSDIEDTAGYYDILPETVEDDSVVPTLDSNEAVVTADGSSGNLLPPQTHDGPDFSCSPGSGVVLRQPQIHSGLDMPGREPGDVLCCLDYSADIDPGPGVGFLRTPRSRVHAVLRAPASQDIEGCLREVGVRPTLSDFAVTSSTGSDMLLPGPAGVLSDCDRPISLIEHPDFENQHGTKLTLDDSSHAPGE